MKVIAELKLPEDEIEDLFPCMGEEGDDVRPTEAATLRAAELLGVKMQDITWHAPDVFDVRYGSNYVATATAGDCSVRFLSRLGEFLEGDDK